MQIVVRKENENHHIHHNHFRDNVVSGNFFFGDGHSHTGGVRLQGTGQVIGEELGRPWGRLSILWIRRGEGH